MHSRAFPPNPNPNPDSLLRSRVLFYSLILSASVLFFLALLIFLFYIFYSLINRSHTSPFVSIPPLKLQKFSYKELKSATNTFNEANLIGKGGSGIVFRGILQNGKSVAVKKLEASSLQAEQEFQNELQILGGLRSTFVVSLLGYCVEKKRRFLVYEFMPNGSLQELLFGDRSVTLNLNWDQRFRIILDISRALTFLHLQCYPPIIHGDIKPSNVLLGLDYRAKISDFGLSRIKTEGDFGLGVDLFSQDLGRSQELLKSQDLLGNSAVSVLGETPSNEIRIEGCTTEVDFIHPLQDSSFSKNSRLYNNVKTLNSNSLNLNGVNEDDLNGLNLKGKEVCISDIDGISLDDEIRSIDHSMELNLNASSHHIDDSMDSSKQWGKDWWWRQDGSGELSSKDYVLEWIGSQIDQSSRNPDWDVEKNISPLKLNLDHSTQLDKSENISEPQIEGLRFQFPKEKPKKKESKSGNKAIKKNKKMQDWWKEERLAELNKKGNKLRKLKAKWDNGFKFKIPNLDMGQFRKCSTTRKQNHNVDFNLRNGWKKKKTHSSVSEMWSRELSSSTSMRGTVCYVAPEYSGCGHLMEKTDIYSFGVLILVIVSGRRPLHVLSSPMTLKKANLISWCRLLAQAGNVLELVDERLKDGYNADQASLCINLALTCLQKRPDLRPDIGEIVKVLKGAMDPCPVH